MSVFRSLKGMVDSLFAPAEDPRKTLTYTYQHQSELLSKVREAMQEMQTAYGHLCAKIEVVRQRVPELEAETREALRAGDEPRARFVLQRRQIAKVELEDLEEQLSAVNLEEQRLAGIEQRLATQIEALLARQELIAARHSAAEAQVYINREIGAVSEELAELDLALADAEDRAERLQKRAAELDTIAAANIVKASPEQVQKDAQRLKLTDDVEEELELFKQEQDKQ